MMYLVWATSVDGKKTLLFEPEVKFIAHGDLPKQFHENSVSSVEALIERWNSRTTGPHKWHYKLIAKG
jgi:hypothetical protein